MKTPYVGQMVHWYRSPGSAPSAAIVTQVGANRVSLGVVYPNCLNLDPHEGVPHVDDPEVDKSYVHHEGSEVIGAWDFISESKSKPMTVRRPAEASA